MIFFKGASRRKGILQRRQTRFVVIRHTQDLECWRYLAPTLSREAVGDEEERKRKTRRKSKSESKSKSKRKSKRKRKRKRRHRRLEPIHVSFSCRGVGSNEGWCPYFGFAQRGVCD